MEALARNLVEHAVQRIAFKFALVLGIFCQHGILGAFQHAVETAENHQRQHDALILRWPVGPTEQIGNAPDEIGKFVALAH